MFFGVLRACVQVSCLVLCHTRELAWQIAREYERFCKHLPEVKVAVLYGGLPVQKQREMLKNDTPHIVVGCPGRVMQLVREGDLKVDKLQYFVLDECDKMLDQKGEGEMMMMMMRDRRNARFFFVLWASLSVCLSCLSVRSRPSLTLRSVVFCKQGCSPGRAVLLRSCQVVCIYSVAPWCHILGLVLNSAYRRVSKTRGP